MATIEELRRQNSFGDAAAAARDSRVAQIPTDGPKAPAADGSQSNPLNTNLGRGLTNTLAALPGGAVVPGAVGAGAGFAARALSATAPATTMVGRLAQGAAPYAPVLGGAVALNSGASPASAPAPSAQTAPTAAPPMPALPSVGDSAAAADADTSTPAAPRTFAEVIRQGNSYSGAANIGGDVSINGQAPRNGGMVSTQNMTAADNLAGSQQQASTGRTLAQAAMAGTPGVATPTVLNSTNDWAARNNLRNAAVSASSIENTRRWGGRGAENNPAMQEYRATLATDQALQQAQPTLAQAAMRENAGIQREGMQQQGQTGRTMVQAMLEQQRLNQAGEALGYKNRAMGLAEAARNQVAAERDPAKRRGLVQYMNDIEGKSTQADPYLVVPGGQHVDPQSGKAYNTPSSVFNRQSGQFVQQPGQGVQGQSGQPYPEGTRLTGKDGKPYTVKNGVPVPS